MIRNLFIALTIIFCATLSINAAKWKVAKSGESVYKDSTSTIKKDSIPQNNVALNNKIDSNKVEVLQDYQKYPNQTIYYVNMTDSLIHVIDSLKNLKEVLRKEVIDTLSDKIKIPTFFSVTLKANFDTLDLKIDDKLYKKVIFPVNVANIPIGYHRFMVKNKYDIADYRDFSCVKDTNITLEFKLSIPKSKLSINTMPQMAEVYIDSERVGLTPLVLEDVEPGKYFIEIKKQGYTTYSTMLEVNGKFDPKLVIPLVPDKPEIKNIYSQPKKVIGMSIGGVGLISFITGIVYKVSSNNLYKEGDDYKKKLEEARLNGLSEKDYYEKYLKSYDEANKKSNVGNIMFMISFISASISIPLVLF